MEPDRFAAVAADEQRAVIAANEACLELQKHLPPVPAEPRSRARALGIVLIVVMVLLVAAYLIWRFVL